MRRCTEAANQVITPKTPVADVALVNAQKADKSGNLIYRKTARNFRPLVAACGRGCIAEVEHFIELGDLKPDEVHTPGIFVDRIVQTENEKRIEQRTVTSR